MKALITLFALTSSVMLSAQMSEFAPIGAKWWYAYNEFSATGYMEIESIDDTLISGNSCKILTKTLHIVDLSYPEPEENIFNLSPEYLFQDDSVIYYYANGEFWTLYDFTAPVSGTWQVYYYDPEIISISECDSIGTVEVIYSTDTIIEGNSLKKLKTQTLPGSLWSFHDYDILEKAGSLFYLFPTVSECISVTDLPYPAPLRCYEDNSIGLLKFTEDDCDYIYLDVNDPPTQTFNVYPNPANDKIYCEIHSGDLTELQLNDITGRNINISVENINDSQFAADISAIAPGLYFLSFFDDHKIIGTQKIIKQ